MTKPEDAPILEDWSTASEISVVLGISRQTTNILIRHGEFDSLHIKGTPDKPVYFVKTSELNEMRGVRKFPRSTAALEETGS